MANNALTVVDISGLIEDKTEEIKEMPIYSEDFETTRNNVLDVLEKGRDALEEFSELTRQSGHPRSYEALSSLMKTMLEASRTLMDLHQTNQKISGEGKQGNKAIAPNGSGNTNIIMVGSSKELLAMLNKKDDV
jgi:hypothetical protein